MRGKGRAEVPTEVALGGRGRRQQFRGAIIPENASMLLSTTRNCRNLSQFRSTMTALDSSSQAGERWINGVHNATYRMHWTTLRAELFQCIMQRAKELFVSPNYLMNDSPFSVCVLTQWAAPRVCRA